MRRRWRQHLRQQCCQADLQKGTSLSAFHSVAVCEWGEISRTLLSRAKALSLAATSVTASAWESDILDSAQKPYRHETSLTASEWGRVPHMKKRDSERMGEQCPGQLINHAGAKAHSPT